MKRPVILILLSLCCHSLIAQNDQPAATPLRDQENSFVRDSIDQYVTQGLKDWALPGLAVVIVKDGKVILMKGYGVRDVVTKARVDSNTLFMIASNTKLFTASSLALLETREKLSLDDPITKYFPDYRLYDSVSTTLVTIRDLLSHRIGTKTFEGDFTFWNTSLSREEIMKRMRLLKPVQHFRQDFGYCNSCFLTAGQVIQVVTGKPWENFVQTNILDPLDMHRTRVLSTAIDLQTDVATPYTTSYSDTLTQVPYDNWNNLAPAASIVSNVNDLSHWLLMQLDSGKYNGIQVLPWKAVQKTRDVNIMISSRKSNYLPTHFTGYGLGLFVGDYQGRQIYWHTGGAGGMVSNVCFVPEEKLGIAILTNNDNQDFFESLRYQILDSYLDVPYVNRSLHDLAGFEHKRKAQADQIHKWKTNVKRNKPQLPLSSYTGLYSNPLYGPIQIVQQENQLIIHFGTKPELSATLDYLDNGYWLLSYNNIEYGIFKVKFRIQDGKVKSITTKQNPFVEYDPYLFTKD
ncbi:MAG: serine hydrolase [Bacteroidota bacterium]|nr:serine hydrolase [Bacteroidota bacterium]MDP4211396.1 serine hydrolase [Bacteroidota bacterium]MDP4248623.1 serine hydrolase [Bacteroidota bacterium]